MKNKLKLEMSISPSDKKKLAIASVVLTAILSYFLVIVPVQEVKEENLEKLTELQSRKEILDMTIPKLNEKEDQLVESMADLTKSLDTVEDNMTQKEFEQKFLKMIKNTGFAITDASLSSRSVVVYGEPIEEDEESYPIRELIKYLNSETEVIEEEVEIKDNNSEKNDEFVEDEESKKQKEEIQPLKEVLVLEQVFTYNAQVGFENYKILIDMIPNTFKTTKIIRSSYDFENGTANIVIRLNSLDKLYGDLRQSFNGDLSSSGLAKPVDKQAIEQKEKELKEARENLQKEKQESEEKESFEEYSGDKEIHLGK